MAAKILLGLHGARSVGEDQSDGSSSNRLLDDLGRRLGCPVFDFPAATHPDPDALSPATTKPSNIGYLPTQAVGYLIGQIEAARGKPVSIRLFGWSTGAIMLCRVASDLKTWSQLGKKRPGKVDLCFAIDPLWSLAAIGAYPRIPANIRRWVCVRQNRHGNHPPTGSPFDKRFWQGVRLRTESDHTQYDEINIATGNEVGTPGFSIPAAVKVTHATIVAEAYDAALRLLEE
jgi:hypothetical protein